jgi:hypothetical protein
MTTLVFVDHSVTVAPAIGAPLNVTVPEMLSVGSGLAGSVSPGALLLLPLHPLNKAEPAIANRQMTPRMSASPLPQMPGGFSISHGTAGAQQ